MPVSKKRRHKASDKKKPASKKQYHGSKAQWGFLKRDVLETIVKILERQENEVAFSPTLRLVNKHWSSVLNFKIKHTEIGMRSDESIILQKFPNLTSVNISKIFSTTENNSTATKGGSGSRNVNISQNNIERQQKEKFKSVIDLVCKIPKLEEVVLSTDDASYDLQLFMMHQVERIPKLKFFTLDIARRLDLLQYWHTTLSKLNLEKVTFRNVNLGFTSKLYSNFKLLSCSISRSFHWKHDPFSIHQKWLKP